MKRNDGFTMVELLVTIAAAAVVTIAAASLILLGVRIQHASTEDASEQQNVRIVMTMLEKMAGNGEIHAVENTEFGWKLLGQKVQDAEESPVLFEYVAERQTLYGTGNSVLLDGLNSAGAQMDGQVLHFTFDTVRGGHYETSTWCHTQEKLAGSFVPDKRGEFLKTLIAEYGDGGNIGKIVGSDVYYSEWYIGGYEGHTDWSASTPWCACFLTWAAVKSEVITRDSKYFFANVDTGIEKFYDEDGKLKSSPAVGDYVFFDWSGGNDPDHVGVVLNVDTTNNTIYTIEGNSDGVIAVRQYPISSNVIIGYGSIFNAPQNNP